MRPIHEHPKISEGGSMNCREAIALIAGFLEQTLTAESLAIAEFISRRTGTPWPSWAEGRASRCPRR